MKIVGDGKKDQKMRKVNTKQVSLWIDLFVLIPYPEIKINKPTKQQNLKQKHSYQKIQNQQFR
jgi:hypothetical protein